MRRTSMRLADGRELIYFDSETSSDRSAPDRRELETRHGSGGAMRHDPLTDEWVAVAGHRQTRIHLPDASECPLCPSTAAQLSEIPESDYEVVVFENRFPSFAEVADPSNLDLGRAWDVELPAHGRCEVVAYTADHEGSVASLTPERMRLVMQAWIDRDRALSLQPGIRYVFIFENRGAEVGVTLHHPHGQVYAYPFVPPSVRDLLQVAARYRESTGDALLDAIVARELADGRRVISEDDHWIVFVPFAARWPYEVQIHPRKARGRLSELTECEQASFAQLFPRLVRALDSIFDSRFPYMSGWTQAPAHASAQELYDSRLFLRVISNRRASDKLKYLASSESLMGAFVTDVTPEDAANRIREAWESTE